MVIKRALIAASLSLAAGISAAEPIKLDGEAIRQALAGKTVAGNQDGLVTNRLVVTSTGINSKIRKQLL